MTKHFPREAAPSAPHITKPKAEPFPESGLVRLDAILSPRGPIPVSKSTWWAGVKSGRFPRSLKLGPRTTVWRAEEIIALIRTLPQTIGGTVPTEPAQEANHEH